MKRIFLIFILITSTAYAGSIREFSPPKYLWWYGCAPTAAGMLLDHYDKYGYGGKSFSGLVDENNPYAAIASSGHISEFYIGGYQDSGDDEPTDRKRDCLADFMGTSQDSVGNTNGSTQIWFKATGDKLYAEELFLWGPKYYRKSGMFGIWDFFYYRGYIVDMAGFYNQYIDTMGKAAGFSWYDYMSEIDSGRMVLIHLAGHTMYGYGYVENAGEVVFHDTWDDEGHTMPWGGEYGGMQMIGVTCIDLGRDFTPRKYEWSWDRSKTIQLEVYDQSGRSNK